MPVTLISDVDRKVLILYAHSRDSYLCLTICFHSPFVCFGGWCLQLTRYAQELLLSVCLNTGAAGHEDKDVIHKLVQIRLKPKQLAEKYMYAVK